MDAEIGTVAGDVYRFLEANGPATASRLKKGTGHPERTIHQALGWLAREDKVLREETARSTLWSLQGRA